MNEFALIYCVRSSFPLHYIVFKQTASHLPHEGNSEQLFSRSGALSDDNGKMDPARLAVWTSIGINYPTYQPSYVQILQRYLLKFSKSGNASSLFTRMTWGCSLKVEMTGRVASIMSRRRMAVEDRMLQLGDGCTREAHSKAGLSERGCARERLNT